MSKKCAICNSLNEDERIYCRKCGSFLANRQGDAPAERRPRSVWELADGRTPNEPVRQRQMPAPQGGQAAGRMTGLPGTQMPAPQGGKPLQAGLPPDPEPVMICPVCQTMEPFRNGLRPLFCPACNYFYQESDRPVMPGQASGPAGGAGNRPDPQIKSQRDPASEMRDPAPDGKIAVRQVQRPGPMSPRSGPMRRRQANRFSLRLICISEKGSFVVSVPPEGCILGGKGTLRPELFRNGAFRQVEQQHLSVWRTDAGWYLRALHGLTLYNGEAVNPGMSRQLSDGDLIQAGDCNLRVELSGA